MRSEKFDDDDDDDDNNNNNNTLHVTQTVNTEKLQHYIPQKHGLF